MFIILVSGRISVTTVSVVPSMINRPFLVPTYTWFVSSLIAMHCGFLSNVIVVITCNGPTVALTKDTSINNVKSVSKKVDTISFLFNLISPTLSFFSEQYSRK